MKKTYFNLHLLNSLILLFFLLPLDTIGQNAIVKGSIIDAEEKESLVGANIILNNGIGTATDLEGNYSLSVPAGEYQMTFKYIGYQTQKQKITLAKGEEKIFNISLFAESNQLNDVVVSASKYEQKLGDVAVSMAIIKPALIENKATRDAEAIIEQVPGVQINENQVSIRGGSGWSYGAGSRVLVMVDGMPMIAGDANDIKWTAIPLENISQIEILKGASSVLYGSSALNGVINIRTQYPKDEPITKINVSNGFYMPGYGNRKGISLSGADSVLNQRNNQTWWEKPRGYVQGNFTHLRKLNENNELVLGGSFMKDQGYRLGSNDQRARINGGWKHFSKKYEGLSYGLNVNTNFNQSTIFFLWAGADSVLHALGGIDSATTTMSTSNTSRIMIDPYISYVSENGNSHQLKTRFFGTDNQNNTNQASKSDFYFGEYQFQKKFKNKLTLTSGAMFSYTNVISELYGDHYSNNTAGYIQADKKWEKFTLSSGMRLEYFKIDDVQSNGRLFNKDLNIPFQPVFRVGGTYQPKEYTFLRASYGQGFRFPSIAEKYISTFVGGLNIFPNPNIQPEYGWSSEIGIKQGFKINNFKGYLDVSAFVTQYADMMEFIFGVYDSAGNDLSNNFNQYLMLLSQGGPSQIQNNLGKLFGARSNNVQNANIPGFEVSVVGKGNLTNEIGFSILAGYTFINPTAVNPDSSYLSTFSNPDTLYPEKSILKYRNRHMGKIDFQLDYKKFSLGTSMRYTSLMQNIDGILETQNIIVSVVDNNNNILQQPTDLAILIGNDTYRAARMTGDVIFDARLAYQVNKKSKFSLLMNNVLNREYTNRPGNVMPPRTILWQYSLTF